MTNWIKKYQEIVYFWGIMFIFIIFYISLLRMPVEFRSGVIQEINASEARINERIRGVRGRIEVLIIMQEDLSKTKFKFFRRNII